MKKSNTVWAVCLVSLMGLYGSVLGASDSALVDAFAKGFAVTAQPIGLEGVMKNPAAMTFVSRKKMLININETYGNDVLHGFFSVGYRVTQKDYVGISVPLVHVCNLPETAVVEGSPVITDTFNAISLQPRVSWARELNSHVRVGLSAIALVDQVYGESGVGFSSDFGVLARFKYWNVGASVQDVFWNKTWSTSRKESKSQILNLGVAFKPKQGIAILSDVGIMGDTSVLNLGAEINMNSRIGVYLGMKDIGETAHFRTGVRVNLNDMSVVYAYGRQGQLADSHKIGLRFKY